MKRTVLSIEDDAVFADIIAKSLVAGGFAVIKSSNGEDGLKKALSEKPDIILLDIGLPGKDGFELLEILKTSSETSSIPVFMLSRLSSREDVDKCFTLGCTDYLIKTQHHPDDVVRRLNRHFGFEQGFARWEVLVALGVVLIAASLLWWQISNPKAPAPVPSQGVELQTP
ncbi:response regulator [Candidatus Uhrbacteria bacterium]|nr:response regulator [Candidatus Uhrbacteria bacterium]